MKALISFSTLLALSSGAPQIFRGSLGVGGQSSHQSVSKPLQGELRSTAQSKPLGSPVSSVHSTDSVSDSSQSGLAPSFLTGGGLGGGHSLAVGVGHTGLGHALVGGVGHGVVGHGIVGGIGHGVIGHGVVGHGLVSGIGHGVVGGISHGVVGGIGHGVIGHGVGISHGVVGHGIGHGVVGHGVVGHAVATPVVAAVSHSVATVAAHPVVVGHGIGHGVVGHGVGIGHGVGFGHGVVGHGIGHGVVGHGVVGHGVVGHGVVGGAGVIGTGLTVYPDEVSPYTYQYNVADDYSGSNFQAQETDDGTAARQGSYSVALPDGRVQTVSYHADDLNGYVAEVVYDGTAAFPPAAPVVSGVRPGGVVGGVIG